MVKRVIKITLETPVEKMLEEYPEAIEYGIMKGVRFFFCVGAYSTTLGDLLAAKNIDNPQEFVDGLNTFLVSKEI
jgi:hypothetical protein